MFDLKTLNKFLQKYVDFFDFQLKQIKSLAKYVSQVDEKVKKSIEVKQRLLKQKEEHVVKYENARRYRRQLQAMYKQMLIEKQKKPETKKMKMSEDTSSHVRQKPTVPSPSSGIKVTIFKKPKKKKSIEL